MSKTEEFFIWFFQGMDGLGGWMLFFLLAVAAVVWLLYDTSKRRLPALGWKTAIILVSLLILPTIMYRFSSIETQVSLDPYVETIFYLGLLGGIMPVVLAIGYYVSFQGMKGCPQGHVYEARLGDCPECNRVAPRPEPAPEQHRRRESRPAPEPVPNLRPNLPKVDAWIKSSAGHTYQLNQGETKIGRSSENHIQIDSDSTVGRAHAKIMEQNGHFRIVDLASANGTFLNNKRVRQPTLLEANDEIRLGENSRFIFISRN